MLGLAALALASVIMAGCDLDGMWVSNFAAYKTRQHCPAGASPCLAAVVKVVNTSSSASGERPTSDATVTVEATTPSGAVETGTGTTTAFGTVLITLPMPEHGTYTIEVTDISSEVYTYEPSQNEVDPIVQIEN